MRALPHIAELLVPEISDAVDWADTVVVTDPVYLAEIAELPRDKVMLDFGEFHRPCLSPGDDERAGQLSKLTSKFTMKAGLSAGT